MVIVFFFSHSLTAHGTSNLEYIPLEYSYSLQKFLLTDNNLGVYYMICDSATDVINGGCVTAVVE